MTKNGGRIWAHDWENSVVDPLGERSSQTVAASRWHRAERVRARRPSSGTDNRQIRVFLVVLSLAPLATSRSVARPWPVPRVSVRRVVPSNSGRRARMRSASGGTKPREFCTPRCTAGLTESGSSRLLLLPQQQSAAAPIRKLMTSIAAGGIRAATAGVRLCTATCPRLRTMCARIG